MLTLAAGTEFGGTPPPAKVEIVYCASIDNGASRVSERIVRM